MANQKINEEIIKNFEAEIDVITKAAKATQKLPKTSYTDCIVALYESEIRNIQRNIRVIKLMDIQ